MRRHMLDVKL